MEFQRTQYLNKLMAHRGNHLIKIITGIRRCGKSYLLNHIFYRSLLNSGVDETHIIKFAFDNGDDVDKLDDFYPELPTQIKINAHQYEINAKKFRAYINSLIRDDKTYYLLLDEVQLLEHFTGTLNGYLYHENYDVYVTGSNSKFLSSDIATEFRGRGDNIYVQPLNFMEYYQGLKEDNRDNIKEALNTYLRFGGLPLCALEHNESSQQEYLTHLYKTIYLADIVQRNLIRKPDELDKIIEITSSDIGSSNNPTKLAHTFASVMKSNITAATVRKYINYLSESFLISIAKRYNVKGKKYIGTLDKYYFTDLGLRNAILGFRQFETTHLMENLIYNELINRGFSVDIGNVDKNEKDKEGRSIKKTFEVDFVANKGYKRYYIQSVYDMPTCEKEEQEERPLDNIKDNFDKIMITWDDFTRYHRNDKGYIIMNIYEFLEHGEYID